MKNIIFLCLLLSQTSQKVFSQDKNPCADADIIYIADWSGSIDKFEYQLVNGLKSLMETLPPQKEMIRYGVIAFNDQSFIEEPLTSDLFTLNSLLEKLSFKKASGGTDIIPALISAEYLFDAQFRLTNKIVVIISDGDVYQNTKDEAILISKRMRENGIIILSVDVGNNYTQEYFLREISSNYFKTDILNLSETLKNLFSCM